MFSVLDMKGAYHTSWYAQFNVQDLSDCLSSHFGGEEFLQLPLFPEFEQVQSLEINISHAVNTTPPDLESRTRSAELGVVSDPSSPWPSIYKVLVSILLNAFPLVVSVGISILSSAGKDLVKEFKTRPELTLLTTSLFMLVGYWSSRPISVNDLLTTSTRALLLAPLSGVHCQK